MWNSHLLWVTYNISRKKIPYLSVEVVKNPWIWKNYMENSAALVILLHLHYFCGRCYNHYWKLDPCTLVWLELHHGADHPGRWRKLTKFAPEILDMHMTAHASTTSVWIFMKHVAYTLYGRRRRNTGLKINCRCNSNNGRLELFMVVTTIRQKKKKCFVALLGIEF